MTRSPETAELGPKLPRELTPEAGADPELEALPKPRRPGRLLTLIAMSLTIVAAGFMSLALWGEASYALRSRPPIELGELAGFKPKPEAANRWAHGQGSLSGSGAIRYERPLEGDTYRLAPIAGNERLWVQIRVPEGFEGPHFVPPNSFVGRLVPVGEAGLRYRGLREVANMPHDAWLLIDGESPRATRWALGLLGLFGAFALFNVYGLVRLLRPVKDG
jgi:hypothetical protein